MSRRQQRKAQTRERLLQAAAARLRADGPDGMPVAEVMADAGLTHGAFYSHFADKRALVDAALHDAMTGSRAAWFEGLDEVRGATRLRWLAGRYLNEQHRDRPQDGCALACLAADAARGPAELRQRYQGELAQSLARLAEGFDEADGEGGDDAAIAFLALCMGGVSMARAVDDPELSQRILRACRMLAPRLAPDADDET